MFDDAKFLSTNLLSKHFKNCTSAFKRQSINRAKILVLVYLFSMYVEMYAAYSFEILPEYFKITGF